MAYQTTIYMSEFVTHDVRRFIVNKPAGFTFEPGQGVELAIDEPEWRDKGRPFTPTSLSDDQVLEFTIKAYPQHKGVTAKLHTLKVGTKLLLSEPFGTIRYRGPGVFIAAGAGITPFMAVLRQLARDGRLDGHSLIFSSKTPADVICEKEFRHYLEERCILTCTRSEVQGYHHRRVDRDFLLEHIKDFDQYFYLCGPPPFVAAIKTVLTNLGTAPQAMVFEE